MGVGLVTFIYDRGFPPIVCQIFGNLKEPPKERNTGMTPLARETYEKLLRTIEPFNVAELKAVLFVAERLAKGRKQYGPLDPWDGRDWLMEAVEEVADLLVYASVHQQERESHGSFQDSARSMGGGRGPIP